MGEGDPRAVSAHLPGSVLQATGDPVCDRHLSLLLRYASSCPSASRCKGSTTSSRSSRPPRSRGKLTKEAPSKASRASVWCEVSKMGIPSSTHSLQALLEASQTAFCASLRQAAAFVPRWVMISTDNTN
jgi:hypothetical protein